MHAHRPSSRHFACDRPPRPRASLDAALPGQDEAKTVLLREFTVFEAQRDADALMARPVLLCGNHPGEMPLSLVRALATHARLPWVAVPAGPGFCPSDVLARLARDAADCHDHHPLGLAVVTDLHLLSPAAARAMAACLTNPDPVPLVHHGRVVSISTRQVFWVGAMQMREATRTADRLPPLDAAAAFAWLAAGPASSEVVAAGVAGTLAFPPADAEQAACLSALARAFPSSAWLLPATRDDLLAWATDEAAPWWPGRRVRVFCDGQGVEFRLGAGAVEAWAQEAERRGSTVEAMEEILRLAMDTVIEIIGDRSGGLAAVEVTPGALTLTEAPRLLPGPRRPPPPPSPVAAWLDSAARVELDRPARTPQSPASVRLARMDDLTSVMATHPTSYPTP